MYSTLEITTAPSVTRLVTLDQLKSDLGLDSQDNFYGRVIDICSEQIALYLGRGRDEDDIASLGRATVREVFYDFCGARFLHLNRFPIGALTSVKEGTGATISRLVGASDGAITATETTFTSANFTFTESHVGKNITIGGS